ncbi:hypothetical protein L7F22_029245 [Adiantum nelumboides]|nr:hypothetical protein [Adiantum nelumboides]
MHGPPYFYFENVAGVPNNEWDTIKRHFNGVDPEYTDSKFFSASRRPRGYVHNLPIEGRTPLSCVSPMTIAEAFPDTQHYWPSWDTREKLISINTHKAPDSLCHLIRTLFALFEGGELPYHRQREIVQVCKKWNLVWVGPGQAAPLEPHEIELVLGVTVLSLFSGIDGAEIALDKLGVHLKVVIAVEINMKPIENLDGEDDSLGDLPDPLPRIDIAEELWDHVDDHTCGTEPDPEHLFILADLRELLREIGNGECRHAGLGSIHKFLGSLTRMGVMDAQAALGGDDLAEVAFTMAYEFMVAGGVVIALCMPEQYITIVREAALQCQQAMTQKREFYDDSSFHAHMRPPSVQPPMSTMSPTGSIVSSWSSFGAPYFRPSLPIPQPMPYPYIPYRPPPHSMPLARPLFPSTSAPPLATSAPPPSGVYHPTPRYPPP